MSTLEQLQNDDSFESLIFEGLELGSFDFSGKDFSGCTFRRTKLDETTWERVLLEDCRFEHCDLTRLRPSRLTLRSVTFSHSKLMGIDWSEISKNPTIVVEECDLRYSSFVGANLRKCAFVNSRAMESNFIDCDLVETDFSGTDLTGANIEGSDLTRANLGTALGAFVDPSKNRVKNARISVEASVLLATALGFRVLGHSPETESESTPTRRRRSAR